MRRKTKNAFCFGVLLVTVFVLACDVSTSDSAPPRDGSEASSDHSDSTTGDGIHELFQLEKPKISLIELRRSLISFEQKQGSELDNMKFLQEDEPEVHWYFPPNGIWLADLRFQTARYFIAARDLKIIRVEYFNKKPSRVSDKGFDRSEIDEYRDIFVRITETQAEKAARDYVETHWSPSVLEGLGQAKVRLSRRNSAFCYSVSWSLQASGGRVLFGVRQIAVVVNPTTGVVYQVDITDVDPPDYYKISAEEFIKIVKEEFEGLKDVMNIKYIQLFTKYSEIFVHGPKRVATKRAVWSAFFTFPCPESPLICNGQGMLMIDADTGEILDKDAS